MRSMPAPGGPHRGRLWSPAGVLAALSLAITAPSAAQEPVGPQPRQGIGGFVPRLPMPPESREFAPSGTLVEGMGSASSFLEVKVGQGRFLTLRENLVVPG